MQITRDSIHTRESYLAHCIFHQIYLGYYRGLLRMKVFMGEQIGMNEDLNLYHQGHGRVNDNKIRLRKSSDGIYNVMRCRMYSMLILLLSCLLFEMLTGCDPVYGVRYDISLITSNMPAKCSQSQDDRLGQALDLIDQIAVNEGMMIAERATVDNDEIITRYYFGSYTFKGLFSSTKKKVRLTVTANRKTRELMIDVADLFSLTQSKFSRNLQNLLIDRIKNEIECSVIQQE